MTSGRPTYNFLTEQARRWDKCVDYGSPMSAWTAEMHETLTECGGDRLKSTEALRQRRAAHVARCAKADRLASKIEQLNEV